MNAAPIGDTKKAKRKVLVVEDDKFLQRIIVMKLSGDDFGAVGASDGEEALRLMLADKPDLVILDLILPRMNGFEVLSEMRTNQRLKDVPVIVLSNLGQDEDISRVKQMGAIDYMTKSNVSIHEVVQKIKEAFAKYLSQKK